MLSGFIFPIDSMPAPIVPLTWFVPLTWAIEILRGAFIKGSGFEALAMQFWVLAAFAVVIFGAAIAATRRAACPRGTCSTSRARGIEPTSTLLLLDTFRVLIKKARPNRPNTIWINRNAMFVIEYTNRLRSSNRRPRYSDSVNTPIFR